MLATHHCEHLLSSVVAGDTMDAILTAISFSRPIGVRELVAQPARRASLPTDPNVMVFLKAAHRSAITDSGAPF